MLVRMVRVLVLSMPMLLASCASYRAPDLEVVDAAVAEVSDEGVVVAFRVRAANRNDTALPLRTVRYAMSVEGRPAFTGRRAAEATIRPFGTQEFVLPVALSIGPGADLASAPSAPLAYSLSGSVEFELPGSIAEVLFDTGIRRPTASFAERGTLDFAESAR